MTTKQKILAFLSQNEECVLATVSESGPEAATVGFTALVYDVDDPTRANEVSVLGTSKYLEGNPSTLGTMVLEPSALYYGEVHPTYTDTLRAGLRAAGY